MIMRGSSIALKARKDRRIEQLAELMSTGYEIKDAAPIIGVTVDRTRRLWCGIKRDLGWQAQ
jgi:hypothetical protein